MAVASKGISPPKEVGYANFVLVYHVVIDKALQVCKVRQVILPSALFAIVARRGSCMAQQDLQDIFDALRDHPFLWSQLLNVLHDMGMHWMSAAVRSPHKALAIWRTLS